jgi:rod shape-determining protein MreD
MIVFSAKTKDWILISASFLMALVLTFLRTPNWFEWLCPQWLTLLVLYWSLVMPQRVSVGVAWSVGLLLDALSNVPLGINALTLVLVVYVTIVFREKINQLYFWEKFLLMFGLMMWCQLLPLFLQLCLDMRVDFKPIFSRALMSVVVWFVVDVLFNYQRKPYSIK